MPFLQTAFHMLCYYYYVDEDDLYNTCLGHKEKWKRSNQMPLIQSRK